MDGQKKKIWIHILYYIFLLYGFTNLTCKSRIVSQVWIKKIELEHVEMQPKSKKLYIESKIYTYNKKKLQNYTSLFSTLKFSMASAPPPPRVSQKSSPNLPLPPSHLPPRVACMFPFWSFTAICKTNGLVVVVLAISVHTHPMLLVRTYTYEEDQQTIQ